MRYPAKSYNKDLESLEVSSLIFRSFGRSVIRLGGRFVGRSVSHSGFLFCFIVRLTDSFEITFKAETI